MQFNKSNYHWNIPANYQELRRLMSTLRHRLIMCRLILRKPAVVTLVGYDDCESVRMLYSGTNHTEILKMLEVSTHSVREKQAALQFEKLSMN